MARIPGIDPSKAAADVRAALEAQTRKWGEPLLPSLIAARLPVIFRAVRGMFAAIDGSGLIPPELRALVNRRVASHNGCVF